LEIRKRDIIFIKTNKFMRYKELLVNKIEKASNLLSVLESHFSRGDDKSFKITYEQLRDMIGDINSFLNRETQD
jgi:hypothetical protein